MTSGPDGVLIAHVPTEATPFGEPVQPHVLRLVSAALEGAGVAVATAAIRSIADVDSLAGSAELVFNLCYGLRSEAGDLDQPGVADAFERAGLSIVGSSAEVQRLCQDKRRAGEVAEAVGVSAPREFDAASVGEADGPLLVKPRAGAAHRGIRIVEDPGSLTEEDASEATLIQEYLDGPEYTIGVIGNGTTARALPLMRVRYGRSVEPQIYRWGSTSTAPDSGSRFAMADAALTLYEALGLRDYARFDFRAVRDRGPVLMDANALPNLSSRQLLATSARWAGIDHPALIRTIVAEAHARQPTG